MKRVTGIGGIFFKSKEPKKLQSWYVEHLGIKSESDGYILFKWLEKDRPNRHAHTVWAPFQDDTEYFEPSKAPFMINFRVENLEKLLEELRKEGVTVIEKTIEDVNGKFGWIMDPEGNKIELWEPADATYKAEWYEK
ncbi:MAG: VOC family protein [Candidatus Thorarchaeota archaeon]|nr:VOC family protein [Candidatus Thorarchaeota archaeon]